MPSSDANLSLAESASTIVCPALPSETTSTREYECRS